MQPWCQQVKWVCNYLFHFLLCSSTLTSSCLRDWPCKDIEDGFFREKKGNHGIITNVCKLASHLPASRVSANALRIAGGSFTGALGGFWWCIGCILRCWMGGYDEPAHFHPIPTVPHSNPSSPRHTTQLILLHFRQSPLGQVKHLMTAKFSWQSLCRDLAFWQFSCMLEEVPGSTLQTRCQLCPLTRSSIQSYSCVKNQLLQVKDFRSCPWYVTVCQWQCPYI